jgi:hypothetical protein
MAEGFAARRRSRGHRRVSGEKRIEHGQRQHGEIAGRAASERGVFERAGEVRLAIFLAIVPAFAQVDFRGVWQAQSTAAFNVEEHAAVFGTPAGRSVIIDPPDGKLPYLPGMREKAMDNNAHRERDPVGHCHMHGVPRVMLPPFPLEIIQDGDYFVILSETEHGVRIIPMDGRPHRAGARTWNGDSRGRWEGNTLVVDVTGLNGRSWLDQAGNFVDENARVVERFTLTDPSTITYEATVTDPTVYSRPWTLRVQLRKRTDVELLEYGCIEGERDGALFPSEEKQ